MSTMEDMKDVQFLQAPFSATKTTWLTFGYSGEIHKQVLPFPAFLNTSNVLGLKY